MRVLIYEPKFDGGHNLTYVRHLVSALSSWPVEITVVSADGADTSSDYKAHLQPFLEGRGDLRPLVRPPRSGMDWGRHYFEGLLDSIDQVRPDHVFVPTGDILAAYAGSQRMRGLLRWGARPPVECNVLTAFYGSNIPKDQKAQRLKTSVYASHAPWARTFTIDPFNRVDRFPLRWVHRRVPEILPDPVTSPCVTDKREARNHFSLPENGLIVGGVGHFASNPRKNPVGLIRGFLGSQLSADGFVALIGPMSREALQLVDGLPAEQRRRVFIVNRLLSSEEVQTAVAALDLVCVPYRDFFQPSAIVLNAAVLGRPVLAPRTGWFESMIPLFRLGWVTDLGTDVDISRALDRHRAEIEEFVPSNESQRLARFSHASNFAALFTGGLGIRLGVSPAQPATTWTSIREGL